MAEQGVVDGSSQYLLKFGDGFVKGELVGRPQSRVLGVADGDMKIVVGLDHCQDIVGMNRFFEADLASLNNRQLLGCP